MMEREGRRIDRLQVLNDGASFLVNCLKGDGIAALREAVLNHVLTVPFYGEPIPTSYIALQTAVEDEFARGQTYLSWAHFAQLAASCGLDATNTCIATRFLHEVGTLKFFEDVEIVLQKAQKWHPPLTYLSVLEDSVYISYHWIVDSLKGLIRHDRGALLAFFGQDGTPDRSPPFAFVCRCLSPLSFTCRCLSVLLGLAVW